MEETKGGSEQSMEFVFEVHGFLLLVPFILFALACRKHDSRTFYFTSFVLLFPFILCVLYFHYSIPCPRSRLNFLYNLDLCEVDDHVEVYLPVVVVVVYIALRFMNRWYVKKNARWSKRECRILEAVCEDISNCKARPYSHVEERYRQFLNSDQAQEIMRRKLSDKEDWVNRTKEVVRNAGFLSPKKEPNFFAGAQQWLNRQILLSPYMEVRSIRKNLLQQRRESDFVKVIYEELEKSRAKLRSLESMLIEDEKKQVPGHMPSTIEKVAQHIPGKFKKKYQFKYELVEALLKDLQHAKLEGAIEKAWLEEMKAFLGDTVEALNRFTRRKERKGLYTLFNYIFSMADNSLKRDLQWMDDELTELLDTKSRYAFKLIIIQQQTDPYHVHDHISSVVNKIRNSLKDDDLCNKLEKIHKSLIAMEGASNFRIKCSERMKTVADELNKIIEKHNQTGEALDRISHETSSIGSLKDQIKFIEKFIGACDLVRRKSSSIIGLEEDTQKLVSKLTSDSEQPCIFFIVGMQGIGKTTLAKKIYHDQKILNHFSDDCRIWVSLTNNGNNAVLNVGNKITGNDERQKPEKVERVEVCIRKIEDFLQEKKCLVVLDDVSTKEVCGKLKNAFSASGNGSKFLLTTRDMTMGSETDECHPLRLRAKEESWELFVEKVQFPLLSKDDEIVKEAQKVVGRCWGLPYTLSCLGVLLAGETINAQLLKKASEQAQLQEISQLWSKNLEILNSNDDLKRCFSCCTLFPKDYEIPLRRLIAIWVAEGLVQEKPGDTNAKGMARDCLLELINFNIIQPLKKNVHGTERTCCVPVPLLDKFSRQGNQQQPLRCVLSTSSSDQQRLEGKYHNNDGIVTQFVLKDSDDIDIHPPNVPPNSDKSLVSLISFDSREGDKPGNDIGKIIANGSFKMLKFLDLERVFRPQFSKAIIAKLVELRYLGLRWTYLEKIPSNIGKLLNLQTLDLKHTYIRFLPNTIWEMRELRHLYLNQTCRVKFVKQSKTKSLPNLQTLWGIFLDENYPRDLLDKLKSLTKLELSFHLSSEQQEELAGRIAELTKLRSLRLRSVGVMSKPEHLQLGDFKKLESLSSMYLFGRLNALHFSKFPKDLSDLTLSASGLKDDPMPVLEKFPKLRSLSLFADSLEGECIVCSKKGFSELIVLKIWKLNKLKVWTIEEQAMQKLKELEIRSCPKLEVPDGLMHLQTLRQVKLRNMQPEFTKRLDECARLRPDPPSIIDLRNQV